MFNRRRDFQENPNSFLPSPEVLAGYEKMAPGATKELMEMVKKEQEHRHKWQNRYLESYNFTYRFGQVMGAFYMLGLLYMMFNLIVMKEIKFSIVLMCFTIIIVFIGMLTTRGERAHMRKRPRKELINTGGRKTGNRPTSPQSRPSHHSSSSDRSAHHRSSNSSERRPRQ